MMSIGYNGKVFSHEASRYDQDDCRLCHRNHLDGSGGDLDDLMESYIPKCCKYHAKKALCIHGRRIRQLDFEINKPSDEKVPEIPELDVSIVKNCSRAVQAVVDNDRTFLQCFLTNYPSHIDASLPYNPNYTYDHTGKNFTLLQIAVMEDNPEAVELILEFQPDTSKKPYPLLLACHRLYKLQFEFPSDYKYCHSKKIHDMIGLLLAHGADPNVLYYDRFSSDAPKTPLTYCILIKSVEAVKMLLDHNAKPLPDVHTDNYSATTSTAFLQKILPYSGKKVEEKAIGYDLHVSDGQLQEQEMAQITRQIFCTYMSVGEYYFDIFLKMLIEHGLDVNAYYGDLKPIHFACIPPCSLGTVKVLLKHGVDINDQDKNGEFTALHQLLVSNYEHMSPKLVEELLLFGAGFYIKGRIPVKNSNIIPSHLIDVYKSRLPLIFAKGQSYTALDLLPAEFPRDIFFCEPKQNQKMVKPVNTPHNKPDKAPGADKKPSLPPETIPGATSIRHPSSALPSHQPYPTPSCPGYASDVDSRPPPYNPGMDNSRNVYDLPPPYELLFPKKKSWLPWKRK